MNWAPLWPLCFVPRTQAAPSPAVCLIACRSKHYPSLWKLGNLCRLWMAPDPNLPQPQATKMWVAPTASCQWRCLGASPETPVPLPTSLILFSFPGSSLFHPQYVSALHCLKRGIWLLTMSMGIGCFSPASLLWSLGDFQLWRELVMFPSLNLTLKIVASIKKWSSETWAWVWCG